MYVNSLSLTYTETLTFLDQNFPKKKKARIDFLKWLGSSCEMPLIDLKGVFADAMALKANLWLCMCIVLYHYNWECLFVCLFVRNKCQNYRMDWHQLLWNYEEWPRECPSGIEIAHLSTFEKILWRLFLRGGPPFLLISLPLPALA